MFGYSLSFWKFRFSWSSIWFGGWFVIWARIHKDTQGYIGYDIGVSVRLAFGERLILISIGYLHSYTYPHSPLHEAILVDMK